MTGESSRKWGDTSTRRAVEQARSGWEQKNHVLDAAYDEYCLLRGSGESFSVAEFVARYPSYQKSLRRLIDLHECVDGTVDFEATRWPEPGERHFGFELLDELGSGGVARVYLAREPALGSREVVVKFSLGGGYEAEVLGKLSHPNIVPVFSVHSDEESGLTAVCMPYLGSSTLADVLEELFGARPRPSSGRHILDALQRRERSPEYCRQHLGKSPPSALLQRGSYAEAVVDMGIQLAGALAYTAERRIVHRDLKPSNILLTPSGRPMLLDFNLSVNAGNDMGRLGGTLPYMAPEQIGEVFFEPPGGVHADPRSDLFSLGVILYEMLTGKLPFGDPARCDPRTIADGYLAAQRKGPRQMSRLVRQLGPAAARVIESCLAFEMERRPDSPTALAEMLKRYFAPPKRLQRAVVRNRRAVLFTSIGAASVAASAWGLYLNRPSKDRLLFLDGLNHLESHDYDAAISSFSESLAVNFNAPHVVFARGVACLCCGRYQAAVTDLERVKSERAGESLYDCLGYAYLMTSNYASSSGHYKRAAQLAEGRRRARLLLNEAYSLKREHRYGDCFRRVTAAIDEDPEFQAAYHFRSTLVLSRNSREVISFQRARQDIEVALGLGDSSWALEFDAAKVYATVTEQTEEDYTAKIERHLRSAARKGAPRRNIEDRWIKRWLNPSELLEIRSRLGGQAQFRLTDAFVTAPNLQSIVDQLKRGQV